MTPAQLKTSILLNAIQGKLVEQIDTELCCDIKSTYQGEAFDLFDIPVNWKWVAIKDVATINTGLAFKKQDQKTSVDGTLRILRGGNIGDDYKYHLYDNDIYVDLSQFKDKYIPLQIGDVITPSVTSMEKMCKTGFIDVELENTTAGGFVYIIRSNNPSILDSKYLLYFISSSFNKEQCKPNIHKSGQAFYNLKKSGFVEQPICLPPIEEQHRIVSKIEELLTYVDRYAEAYEKLEQFNAKFPEDMKKSILQYAIQGKLVEQRPEEGSAEELYKAIQKEKQKLIKEGKIKKEKPLAEITEDEIPFDIPDSWRWVRFAEFGSYKKGPFGSALTKSMFVPKGKDTIKVYEQKNAIQKDATLGEYYITKEYYEKCMTGFEVHSGDVIVSCAGTIGETFIMPDNIEKGIINQALMRMQLMPSVYKPYFLLFFDVVLKKNAIKSSKGSAIKNIPPFDELKAYLVPLPPLEEQHRIVAKIEELLPYCDRLVK